MRTVRNDPFVTRQDLQTDLSRNGTNVCKRTIGNELHRQDLKSKRVQDSLIELDTPKSETGICKNALKKENCFFKHI